MEETHVSHGRSERYVLELRNESAHLYNLCVYQTLPERMEEIRSVVCFSMRCHPGTRTTFEWSGDARFIWARMTKLRAGEFCRAAQDWPCDAMDGASNGVSLIRECGAYRFEHAEQKTPSGSICIYTDGTIPNGQLAAGLGLRVFDDGRLRCLPTLVAEAVPNFSRILMPSTQLWATFGHYEVGEILDLALVNNPVRIDFPMDVYALTATLDERNEWLVG